MPQFFVYLGSYVLSRLLEPSTLSGIGLVYNAVALHQGTPAIVQASIGVAAAVLPDSISKPIKDIVTAIVSSGGKKP
jgi:hypothetical protein